MITLRRRLVAPLFALAAGAGPGLAEEVPQVLFQVSPERVGMGEPVVVSFEVPRAGLRARQLQPRFQVDNLRVAAGPSRQDSMIWADGVLSRRQTVSWQLVPERPGHGRIFDVTVTLGEETMSFPDRTVEVTREPQRPAGRHGRLANDPFDEMFRGLFGPRTRTRRPLEEADLILEAEVEPAQPYVGQQAVYTLYLLTERRRPGEGRVQVETIYPRRIPSFPGFWAQDVSLPQHSRVELVEREGRTYLRQPVLRRALFALGGGDFELAPAEVELRLVTFAPTFFGDEPLRPSSTTRESNSVRLRVRPLPRPPPGFDGAVGSFQVEGTVSPTSVGSGEAAILTLLLEGTGNLASLPDPELPSLPGLRHFPPRQESAVDSEGPSLRSRRTWSWALVPERAGDWEIPPFEWSHFDPAAGVFRTLRTRPLRLSASGGAHTVAEEALPQADHEPPLTFGTPGATGGGLLAGWVSGLPYPEVAIGSTALLVLFAGVALWRRRRPTCLRQRRLLDQLREASRDQQPRQAAATAESAWRDFLAERWQIPRGAPCSGWDQLLRRRGVEPPVVQELVRLMDDLHYLRYAPQLAATAPLRKELWERSFRLLRLLR